MVSLECLQQPGASKLFSFGLESKRFRPSGPGGLCHSPQPCTAAQKQPEITCLHRGTAVRQENSVYTTGGGLFLFLSRQWVFCPACLYGWTQIEHSPPINCPEWTDIFVTRIWPTKSETGSAGTGEESQAASAPARGPHDQQRLNRSHP